MAAQAAATTSYNGWTIGQPGSVIGVATYLVPNTSIQIPIRSGDVSAVLIYVARRFNAEVERLVGWQVFGYDYRRNVNNPSVWSNHASGTAIDLNSDMHPNGVKGSFSATKVAAIRRILTYCGGVVYWGGDYTGTVDAMHFEINVGPSDPRLPALAAKIRGPQPVRSLLARADNRFVCADHAGTLPLIANRSAIGAWEQFDYLSRGGNNVALRSRANGRYVCAESGGAKPLIANRTVIGPWETFTVIHNTDGTVSLRALANGRYVTAESGGAKALIANRTAIGPWEKFSLVAS